MDLIVNIGHPADVHFFKNMIWDLEKKGHNIKITARDKDVTLNLLDTYNLKYERLGKHHKGQINKAIGMLKFDYRLYKVAKKFKPDILTGFGSPYAVHVAKLIGRSSIIFTDTEHSKEQYLLYSSLTDVVCTPSCFKRKLNPKKHVTSHIPHILI